MHRPARSSRTKAGWTEPQQRQACITVGWSWQARSAEQDVGLGRTEVTTRRYNSLGRLLAVARCVAALARLGAGARYAKLWRGALSPTSRQHAYKSAVLALGLPSYPRYHVRLTIHFLLCHLFLHICEVRSCVCLSK